MIKVLEYRSGHFDFFDKKMIYAGDCDLENRTDFIVQSDMTFAHTLVKDNKPLAIVGGTVLWKGVVEIWAITSEDVKGCAKEFHAKVLQLINFYKDELKLRRAQCTVKVGFIEGLNWIKRLGFEVEGVLKSYGPDGSDYFMCGRVFNGCSCCCWRYCW